MNQVEAPLRLDLSSPQHETGPPMDFQQPGNRTRLGRWPALAVCSAFLVVFGVLSYSAALQKSATIDEPVEALGSWTQLHLHDFRMNFEHPALWHYLAALPNGRNAIQLNPSTNSPSPSAPCIRRRETTGRPSSTDRDL